MILQPQPGDCSAGELGWSASSVFSVIGDRAVECVTTAIHPVQPGGGRGAPVLAGLNMEFRRKSNMKQTSIAA